MNHDVCVFFFSPFFDVRFYPTARGWLTARNLTVGVRSRLWELESRGNVRTCVTGLRKHRGASSFTPSLLHAVTHGAPNPEPARTFEVTRVGPWSRGNESNRMIRKLPSLPATFKYQLVTKFHIPFFLFFVFLLIFSIRIVNHNVEVVFV